MGWATFRAIFSKTHLVTLTGNVEVREDWTFFSFELSRKSDNRLSQTATSRQRPR
jgi:hypothetical protein